MITDRVGDFIIRLKNAGAIGAETVSLPYSKHLEQIANKLKELGFVSRVEVTKKAPVAGKSTFPMLEVTLAYDAQGQHKIHDVKRISKPGRRMYVPARDAHTVKNGLGARVLSTPKGILSDKEARKVRAGGETLFEVW